MDLGLAGRVALVTGGSAGIGKSTARALMAEGVDVAIAARQVDRLEAAAEELRAAAGPRAAGAPRVLAVPSDMTSPASIDALVRAVVDAFGRIDILVNNAGGSRFGDPLEIDDDAFEEAMRLKYLGYVRCARAAAPHMIRRGWGRIVNVIGSGGRQVVPSHLPGGAANAALILFTKGFALRLAPHGVLVNAVSPAGVATDRLVRLVQALAAEKGLSFEDAEREFFKESPLGRAARPDEVADAVVFLASERATYFVGANLSMDGGTIRAT
jgi:NAD(P)-dependent dehydrogenase (short-subunit alcohol dehydrogenase family)